jgi:hypothetical protein
LKILQIRKFQKNSLYLNSNNLNNPHLRRLYDVDLDDQKGHGISNVQKNLHVIVPVT